MYLDTTTDFIYMGSRRAGPEIYCATPELPETGCTAVPFAGRIETGWVLERSKTCGTSGEESLLSLGPLRGVFELKGKHPRLETKRECLRPREIMR